MLDVIVEYAAAHHIGCVRAQCTKHGGESGVRNIQKNCLNTFKLILLCVGLNNIAYV